MGFDLLHLAMAQQKKISCDHMGMHAHVHSMHTCCKCKLVFPVEVVPARRGMVLALKGRAALEHLSWTRLPLLCSWSMQPHVVLRQRHGVRGRQHPGPAPAHCMGLREAVDRMGSLMWAVWRLGKAFQFTSQTV